ncbi:MAG: PD-(D/E)XK motif protein [Candidatus Dormibacteraceae bacterium]
MTSLDELFQSLTQPSPGGLHTRFAVVPINDDLRHLVGKDQNGFPAILVDASGKDGNPLLRVELEHLTVLPDVHCDVEFPDEKHRVGSYTLIRCSGDDELQGLFLRLVGGLLQQINAASERAELAHVVVKLVDLFRALTVPPRKSVQGLWAELFLVAQCRNPVMLLEAWHADPTELYDFSREHQRLDVKSSSRRARGPRPVKWCTS